MLVVIDYSGDLNIFLIRKRVSTKQKQMYKYPVANKPLRQQLIVSVAFRILIIFRILLSDRFVIIISILIASVVTNKGFKGTSY